MKNQTGILSAEEMEQAQADGWASDNATFIDLCNVAQSALYKAMQALHNLNAATFSQNPDGSYDAAPVIQGTFAATLNFMVETGMPDEAIREWVGSLMDCLLPQFRMAAEVKKLGAAQAEGRA